MDISAKLRQAQDWVRTYVITDRVIALIKQFFKFLNKGLTHPITLRVIFIIKQFFGDLKQSFINVIKGLRPPAKSNYIVLILQQMIGFGSGWAAGIIASNWIDSRYKYKSVKNLWGLKGRRDGRTVLSREEFENYAYWTKLVVGLVILICVRYLVLNMFAQYQIIIDERKEKRLKEKKTQEEAQKLAGLTKLKK